MMGTNSNGKYVDEIGVETLKKYAEMYGFDSTTGIEIWETDPRISDSDVVRSAMGQSRHGFTTTQLARYAATIANSGTCYDLTLLERITDADGNLVQEKQPVVHNQINMDPEFWDVIHTGMNLMVRDSSVFKESQNFDMAGKTGTAEETGMPNHALFIGYAPYNNPEMAIAVRITNGYSSGNAAAVANDVISYMFGLKEESEIITGTAMIKDYTSNQVRDVYKRQDRDSANANSAMIVTVTPEDFVLPYQQPQENQEPEEKAEALSGIRFQRELERIAYEAGNGSVPVQLFEDFVRKRPSKEAGDILPCIRGAYQFTNLRSVLPKFLGDSLAEGITGCGRIIPGFDRPDAVLSGIESRTSSPVRIERGEDFQSSIKGLYPGGEGAGYAGGITSAAMDGMKIAEAVAKVYSPCCRA